MASPLPLSAGRNLSPSLDFCCSGFKAERWFVVRLLAVVFEGLWNVDCVLSDRMFYIGG